MCSNTRVETSGEEGTAALLQVVLYGRYQWLSGIERCYCEQPRQRLAENETEETKCGYETLVTWTRLLQLQLDSSSSPRRSMKLLSGSHSVVLRRLCRCLDRRGEEVREGVEDENGAPKAEVLGAWKGLTGEGGITMSSSSRVVISVTIKSFP